MADRKPRIALLPLGRATFDVALAEQVLARSLQTLQALDAELIGPRELLFDAAAARDALDQIKTQPIDLLLLLQVTFTDATMTATAAAEIDAPIALWATPEPRTGGRLRLNALCGLNLAAHALGRRGIGYDTLFAAADDTTIVARLAEIISHPATSERRCKASHATMPNGSATAAVSAQLDEALADLDGAAIGRVGEHPEGFDTCSYDADFLADKLGVKVEPVALSEVFNDARAQPDNRIAALHDEVAAELAGLDEMDPPALDKSLRLYGALADRAERAGYPALAVRCWPEMFTDYGCAACGAMARLNQQGVPAACEADVDGAITALLLQRLSGGPALITDLVDVDAGDDTAVLWHCGLAPLAMADPQDTPRATIHSNRQKPLLNEFAFKPGTVTLARLSKAQNQPKLVIGMAEMLRAPRPFGGTAGTLRFDTPAGDVLQQVLDEGLEHHFAFTYGDLREPLRALAARLQLPVLALGAA